MNIGLISLTVDAEVLKLKIVHALELGKAESSSHIVHKISDDLGGDITGLDKGRSVVRSRNSRERIDPIALAAFKQRGDLGSRGLCRRDLFRAAVGKKLKEQARRCAAEAVSDEVYLLLCAPALEQGLIISYAVAIMSLGGRVRGAVVDRRAGQLCVELAGSVPRAGERADLSGVALIALGIEILHKITRSKAPIRHYRVEHRPVAPAHEAVDEHEGIVILRVCLLGRRRDGHQAAKQQYREHQTEKSF